MLQQPLRPSVSEALPEAVEQHISSKLQMKQANNGAGILTDNFWTKFGEQCISFELQIKQANN